MVTKCANPSCSAPFQYLRGGKLFLVDPARFPSSTERGSTTVRKRAVEYVWLCDRCSSELTVTVDSTGQAGIARARASNSA